MDTTSETKKKKNQLTQTKGNLIGRWIRETDLTGYYTFVDVQRQASIDLAFPVSMGSLQNSMAFEGKHIAVKPGAPEPEPGDMATLVKELNSFMTNPAFHQPSAAFTALRFKLTPPQLQPAQQAML